MRQYLFALSMVLAIIVPSVLGYVEISRSTETEELPPLVKSGMVFGKILVRESTPYYYHVIGIPELEYVTARFRPATRSLSFFVERDVWVKVYIVKHVDSHYEIVYRDQHLLATVLKKGLWIKYRVREPGKYTLYVYVIDGDLVIDTYVADFIAIEPQPIKAKIVFSKRVFCRNETINYKIIIKTNEPVTVANPQGPYELYRWNGEKWVLVERSAFMGLAVLPGEIAVKTIYYKLEPGKYKVVERIRGDLTGQTITVEAEFLVIECG